MTLTETEQSTIKQLIFGVASTEYAKAMQSARTIQTLMIGQHAESGMEHAEQAFEDMQLRTPAVKRLIKQTIHENPAKFKAKIKILYENFLQASEQAMDFWNNTDPDAPIDMDSGMLKSIAGDILEQAGEHARPLKNDLLNLLETEIGSLDGITTDHHKWTAMRVLANMSAVSDGIFNKILAHAIENEDHVGRSTIQNICQNDVAKFALVTDKLNTCDDNEDLCELMNIIACVGQASPSLQSDVVGILSVQIESPAIEVAAAACNGLHLLEAIAEDLKPAILKRRSEQINKHAEDIQEELEENKEFVYSRHFQQQGEPTQDQLLRDLQADDPYIRGRAAEGLEPFVDNEVVARALVQVMRDEEGIGDYELPAFYAMRSLAKSKVHAHLANDRLADVVNSMIQDEFDTLEKNQTALVTGVEYFASAKYDWSVVVELVMAMGDAGQDVAQKLKQFKTHLALHDIAGWDQRVEKISALEVSG